MTKSTELPNIFTTLADTDELLVNSQGETGRITVANAKKVFGGSGGGSSGSAPGATNLLTSSDDLTSQADWFQYDSTSSAIVREGPLKLKYPADGGGHVIYQAIPFPGKLTVGQKYTVGFKATRTANSGTGKMRVTLYDESAGSVGTAVDVAEDDGVEFTSSVSFTPTSNYKNLHIGLDGTAGGGEFTITADSLTLVTGGTYNPDATPAS